MLHSDIYVGLVFLMTCSLPTYVCALNWSMNVFEIQFYIGYLFLQLEIVNQNMRKNIEHKIGVCLRTANSDWVALTVFKWRVQLVQRSAFAVSITLKLTENPPARGISAVPFQCWINKILMTKAVLKFLSWSPPISVLLVCNLVCENTNMSTFSRDEPRSGWEASAGVPSPTQRWLLQPSHKFNIADSSRRHVTFQKNGI